MPPTIDSPPPHEVLRTLHLPIRVALTDEEHRAKGQALAAQHQVVVQLEEEHKAAKAGMKADENEAKAKLAHLATDVRTQTEVRSVECEEIANYDKGTVDTIRLDTGAIVDTRTMRDHDRQRKIVPDPDPADGESEDGEVVERSKRRKSKAGLSGIGIVRELEDDGEVS
jgi:hypothetical protein